MHIQRYYIYMYNNLFSSFFLLCSPFLVLHNAVKLLSSKCEIFPEVDYSAKFCQFNKMKFNSSEGNNKIKLFLLFENQTQTVYMSC